MEGENGLLEVKPSCPGSLRTARIPVKNVQGNIKVFFCLEDKREEKRKCPGNIFTLECLHTCVNLFNR